jgi:hypothetical protein
MLLRNFILHNQSYIIPDVKAEITMCYYARQKNSHDFNDTLRWRWLLTSCTLSWLLISQYKQTKTAPQFLISQVRTDKNYTKRKMKIKYHILVCAPSVLNKICGKNHDVFSGGRIARKKGCPFLSHSQLSNSKAPAENF